MSSDDELIEAMLVAMYDDGCPGAVDSMRAVLALVRAHDRDGERYRYWREHHGWSGYFDDGASNSNDPKKIDAAIDAATRAEG